MTRSASEDDRYMARALTLAVHGIGFVEPNPPVGCVIVNDGHVVGEGFHEQFGGPHAEVNALAAADERAAGATVYVTLEPCCHHGKTPPCTEALIAARVGRVVAAVEDPFPHVHGHGFAQLRSAGIECNLGARAADANWLLAPYHKLVTTGRPWIIAKWAMTLDGKLATYTGDSQWISSESSRAVVHQLRGRCDAVMVGSNTARTDDPLLTARPIDRGDLRRVATRIVVDSSASLLPQSRLVQTVADVPLMIATASDASAESCQKLADSGAEVFRCSGDTHAARIDALLDELGRRRMTNVLVEGGSRLLGTLFEMHAVDEVHVFVAPKLAGGEDAPSPVGGAGVEFMNEARRLSEIAIEELDGDVHIHGRVRA